MSTTSPRLLTAEEFFWLPETKPDGKSELVRGIVVTRPFASFVHGLVHAQVAALLDIHAETHDLGRCTIGTGVITQRNPDTVRDPDVSFWSFDRLPEDESPVGYPEVAPDFCAEILAPEDCLDRLREKIAELFACGVRLVWVIDPDERTATVYLPGRPARVMHECERIDGAYVLPGFRCAVANFFADW